MSFNTFYTMYLSDDNFLHKKLADYSAHVCAFPNVKDEYEWTFQQVTQNIWKKTSLQ